MCVCVCGGDAGSAGARAGQAGHTSSGVGDGETERPRTPRHSPPAPSHSRLVRAPRASRRTQGMTALHIASARGHTATVAALLAAGGDVGDKAVSGVRGGERRDSGDVWGWSNTGQTTLQSFTRPSNVAKYLLLQVKHLAGTQSDRSWSNPGQILVI